MSVSAFEGKMRGDKVGEFAFAALRGTASSRVDQHQFGILQRGDVHGRFVANGGAIAGVDAHAVDLDRAHGGDEIPLRVCTER